MSYLRLASSPSASCPSAASSMSDVSASGPSFFTSIFLAGVIVTVVPLAVGTFVARFLFKLSPLMALGSLAGAQTCTPGLTALREASDSNVSSLAYTVPYAIGNIVLTIWGPVVVAIVHAIRH